MKPIILNAEGETMKERPRVDRVGTTPDEDNASHDAEVMEKWVGIHAHCEGAIHCRPMSDSHCAVYCKVCALRVVYPNSVQTFADLRTHLVAFNP